MKTTSQIESARLLVQKECDRTKTPKERNKLGQFSTPPELASEILKLAESLSSGHDKTRFLDPAFGTGAFYSALLSVFRNRHIEKAVGFEIDERYSDKALELWRHRPLMLHAADFTRALPPVDRDKFNLIVCNPPYVRHHHLTPAEKIRLQQASRNVSGVSLSGLAGLYCYFLLLADAWATDGAICVWLVPSEFLDVNYGVAVKEYLLNKVTLLRIHRFSPEDTQFGDALVSSSVVCFRKSLPGKKHMVDFTFGGRLNDPSRRRRVNLVDLQPGSKWNERKRPAAEGLGTKLSDLFDIKRGLATGGNDFFILTKDQISEHRLPMQFLRPILPSPRYLPLNEVSADEEGNPVVDRQLFLLDCRLPEGRVRREYPSLWRYLELGKSRVSKGYLCGSRSPWYSQEDRPAPLFLCTYMGRSGATNRAPFRFILNHSKATAANVYLLLYPREDLRRALHAQPSSARKLWSWLNAISPQAVVGEGRVYGGGLHKIEPRELGNLPVDGFEKMLATTFRKRSVQLNFFEGNKHSRTVA